MTPGSDTYGTVQVRGTLRLSVGPVPNTLRRCQRHKHGRPGVIGCGVDRGTARCLPEAPKLRPMDASRKPRTEGLTDL